MASAPLGCRPPAVGSLRRGHTVTACESALWVCFNPNSSALRLHQTKGCVRFPGVDERTGKDPSHEY